MVVFLCIFCSYVCHKVSMQNMDKENQLCYTGLSDKFSFEDECYDKLGLECPE